MTELEQPNRQGMQFRKFRPRLRYRGSSIGCTILLDVACILIAFFFGDFAGDFEAGHSNRTTGSGF